MDTFAYWKRVRVLERELIASHPDGTVYIASVEKPDTGVPAGKISVATPIVAAKNVTDGKHIIATPEQIEAYKVEDKRKGELIGATARYWARERKGPKERGGLDYAV